MLNSYEAGAKRELLSEAGEIDARLARWQNLSWVAGGTITKLQQRLEEIYQDLERLDAAQQLNPLSQPQWDGRVLRVGARERIPSEHIERSKGPDQPKGPTGDARS